MAQEENENKTSIELSEGDVSTFAHRLQEWGNSLEPKDRALLGMLVTRAQNAEGDVDVQGYTVGSVEDGTKEALGPMLRSGVHAWFPFPWHQWGDVIFPSPPEIWVQNAP
jgi:hypothetical protein